MAKLLHNKIIKELKEKKKELKSLINDIEDEGIENLNYEETEDYGAYKGKLELVEMLLEQYGK